MLSVSPLMRYSLFRFNNGLLCQLKTSEQMLYHLILLLWCRLLILQLCHFLFDSLYLSVILVLLFCHLSFKSTFLIRWSSWLRLAFFFCWVSNHILRMVCCSCRRLVLGWGRNWLYLSFLCFFWMWLNFRWISYFRRICLFGICFRGNLRRLLFLSWIYVCFGRLLGHYYS